MIPVQDALDIVVREATRVKESIEEKHETVTAHEATGRVLSQDLVAPWPIPRARTSIKDGYAVVRAQVNASPLETVLPVAASIFAGARASKLSSPGAVVYVTTGSVIPDECDAVVEVEQTKSAGEGCITIQTRNIQDQQDIRKVGSDVEEGQLLLHRGDVIDAAMVGVFAMFGLSTCRVCTRPKVGILSTGDELMDPLGQGTSGEESFKVFDCNRPMLLAACAEHCNGFAQAVDLGILQDRFAKLDGEEGDAWLDEILSKDGELDILVTSGAVSVGAKDFVRTTLERRGAVLIEKLFMKPGKPLLFAKLPRPGNKDLLFFGLPGNPVSSLVTFNLLVVPAIRILAGWRKKTTSAQQLSCDLAHDIQLDPIRPEYHRASLIPQTAGSLHACSTGFQRSSALPSMLGADVLLKLPDARAFGAPVIPKGSTVNAVIFNDLRIPRSCSRPQPPRVLDLGAFLVDYSFEQGLEEALQAAQGFLGNILHVDCPGATTCLELAQSFSTSGKVKLKSSEECQMKVGVFVHCADSVEVGQAFLAKMTQCKGVVGLDELIRASCPWSVGQDMVLCTPQTNFVICLARASPNDQVQKLKSIWPHLARLVAQ